MDIFGNLSEKIEWLKQAYFSVPEKRIFLKKGECLLREGESNNRLFLVISGSLNGKQIVHNTAWQEERSINVLFAQRGDFIGVYSFFSGSVSLMTVEASENSEVAYIETGTLPIEPEKYGTFVEQFMPIMIHEMASRYQRLLDQGQEKETALYRLNKLETAATLGQLAAGLSHELNNAVGVLARKTEYITTFVEQAILSIKPKEHKLFKLGQECDRILSSGEMRQKARDYEERFNLKGSQAKTLAKMAPTEELLSELGKNFSKEIDKRSMYWVLGHDLRDMKMAAEHASGIVRSVRVLGGSHFKREAGIKVYQSFEGSIALLKQNLKGITLYTDFKEEFKDLEMFADRTELAQIWVNLIKNATDALKEAKTENPEIRVSYYSDGTFLFAEIQDNGPGIPQELQEKIFQPDFTTKKNGLSFGLGLGLTIVKRLVDSYEGEITIDSDKKKTIFKVKLLLGDEYGKN